MLRLSAEVNGGKAQNDRSQLRTQAEIDNAKVKSFGKISACEIYW